jgi:hypothetical protein
MQPRFSVSPWKKLTELNFTTSRTRYPHARTQYLVRRAGDRTHTPAAAGEDETPSHHRASPHVRHESGSPSTKEPSQAYLDRIQPGRSHHYSPPQIPTQQPPSVPHSIYSSGRLGNANNLDPRLQYLAHSHKLGPASGS